MCPELKAEWLFHLSHTAVAMHFRLEHADHLTQFVSKLHSVVHELGENLIKQNYRSLAEYIMSLLEELRGDPHAAGKLIQDLADTFPSELQDTAYLKRLPIYFYKKAQTVACELHERFHSLDDRFNFPDIEISSAFESCGLPRELVTRLASCSSEFRNFMRHAETEVRKLQQQLSSLCLLFSAGGRMTYVKVVDHRASCRPQIARTMALGRLLLSLAAATVVWSFARAGGSLDTFVAGTADHVVRDVQVSMKAGRSIPAEQKYRFEGATRRLYLRRLRHRRWCAQFQYPRTFGYVLKWNDTAGEGIEIGAAYHKHATLQVTEFVEFFKTDEMDECVPDERPSGALRGVASLFLQDLLGLVVTLMPPPLAREQEYLTNSGLCLEWLCVKMEAAMVK
eukprot:g10845.t1